MGQIDRRIGQDMLKDLSDTDRAWLEEQLQKYRDLLQYLHDH